MMKSRKIRSVEEITENAANLCGSTHTHTHTHTGILNNKKNINVVKISDIFFLTEILCEIINIKNRVEYY